MREQSLQVTYRKGRILAAYLYLARDKPTRSARSVVSKDALFIVDYGSSGRAAGVEICAPRRVSLETLNQLLDDIKGEPLTEAEFEPLNG